MKRIFFAIAIIILCSSHTMFLKLDSYFLEPNSFVSLELYNGTFEKSENVITRDRMFDASIVSNGERVKVNKSQWTEKDSITFLNFKTGAKGTYVAGISTKPKSLAMDAQAFNTYLEHEGISDMLDWRKNNNYIDSSAVEKYSKHVKTIFQVGDTKTDDWQTNLGYPIEFIPLASPYELHTGDSLEVKLLLNGKPLSNQLVYADYKGDKESHSHDGERSHSHEAKEVDKNHTHATGQKLRTNAEGVVKAHLSGDGIWYFQTIHLINTKEEGLTHESNWATLTFGVTHAHGKETHTHNNEHEKSYKKHIVIGGSLLLIGLLFLWFNKKNKDAEN